MARIGVDARPLSEAAMSGIPRLVYQTLESFSRLDRENQYVLYSHRPLRHLPPGPSFHPRTGKGRIWGSLWIESVLPRLLARDGIDLYWGTEHVLPVWGTAGIPMVLTVHDLTPYLYPETMSRRNLLISRSLFPASVRRADAVVTVSRSTLDDLRRLFPVSRGEVVHAGLTPRFGSVGEACVTEARQRLARDFGLNGPYLLSVGTLEPRKNTILTVRAFKVLADRIPHDLVLAGGPGWRSRPLLEEIDRSPVTGRIRRLGRVSDQTLRDLYAAADIFLFPSLYEGFGSPLLEAMACGVPVITSRSSSLPEVAGDAATLVDPHDAEGMAEAIASILKDPARRAEMIARGRARSTFFNWDHAAREMMRIFRDLAPTGTRASRSR